MIRMMLVKGMRVLGSAALAAAVAAGAAMASEPATTAFTYQGRLTQNGTAASGPYEFEFRLYDWSTDGNLVAALPGAVQADVEDGLFTARLDFGQATFGDMGLWLEIGVRPAGGQGAFTVLTPRQELTATPYAAVALNSPFRREGSGLFYEGRLALGSEVPPSGMLNVVGPPQDASVVLPNNAISSAELLDEPGASGAFAEQEIWFTDTPVTLGTATIDCPGPGYVLALGNANIRSVVYNAAGGFVGIESTATPAANPPSDALQVLFSDDMPSISTTCGVAVHKVFPVTAGSKTFYLRGWRGFGTNSPKSLRAGLTLLFIPTVYGSLPQ